MLKMLQNLKSCLSTFYLFTKVLIVDCRGGVGTFLTRKIHNDVEPIFLDMGYWNVFKLKVVLFCRYIFKNQSLYSGWYEAICGDIQRRLENQNISTEQVNLQIDTYEFRDISSENFFKDYLLKGKPVIIKRGAIDNEDAFSDKYFLEHYGNTKVTVDDVKTGKRLVRTLKDYLQDDDPDRVQYIRTSYNFTLENPDFVGQLNPRQFDAYMSGPGAKKSCWILSELFLGKSKKTGTALHCANGNNLFFMIRGQKRWTFVHPDYTWLTYPILNAPMRYVMSEIIPEVTSLPEAMEKIYPLWKYCPRYTAVLEPGDILLNPSWYWHIVENVTDVTMAMATRWLPINKSTNRFFTLLQYFSKSNWQFVFRIFLANTGTENDDEHVLLATESPDEKVGFGRVGAAKRMWEEQKRRAKESLSPETYRQFCLNLEPQHSEH